MKPSTALAGLAIGAALCAAPAPAAAQNGAAAPDPGFAVAAVGFDSYFDYRLEPGSRRSGRIRLVSRSTEPEVVELRAADVTTASTGGLEYGSGRPRATGTWIDVPDRRITLSPGGGAEVPFTVRVPRDATPGDHIAGLVALNREQLLAARRKSRKKGFSLRFLPRLAIAVQTTVPGDSDRELSVGNVGLDVRPTTTDVTVLIRNSGDELIPGTGGRLTVRRGDRVLLRQDVELDSFVPGTSIQYRLPLTGVPARGTYEVSGRLLPQGAAAVPVSGSASFADEEADRLEAQTGREVAGGGPSLLLIVLMTAAAVAFLIMATALLRLRRRLDEARPSGAADVPRRPN